MEMIVETIGVSLLFLILKSWSDGAKRHEIPANTQKSGNPFIFDQQLAGTDLSKKTRNQVGETIYYDEPYAVEYPYDQHFYMIKETNVKQELEPMFGKVRPPSHVSMPSAIPNY